MTITDYAPILIFILIALALGVIMLVAGSILSPKAPSDEKSAAYECGFPAFEDARLPFDVRFYLVSILFILFDLETAFFFPWALVLRKLGTFGFMAMMLFLLLLIIGFVYEWNQGALEWE
ncbi:MAG: NADH-quinone oxidoreductase subunit A [Legionellales bacterium RIFCSPHIGHO2_12_FULL_37_14]|nr:MAG: NADH-quinone oxidoreductase subunit A [Legionellales bacterium RIFCSPHIGHO2_12_FULL_37_14]